MSKPLLMALLLLGLTIVAILLSHGRVDVSLIITELSGVRTQFAFLGFTAVGIMIGVLLK